MVWGLGVGFLSLTDRLGVDGLLKQQFNRTSG